MKANEIMTRDPRVVTPETSAQEAASLMESEDTGVLPVVESDQSRRLIGIITDRDIALRIVGEGRTAARVRDAMTEGARAARADDDVKSVMEMMAGDKVRRIPIVDEAGAVIGIISQADIVRDADDDRAERTIERISEPGG